MPEAEALARLRAELGECSECRAALARLRGLDARLAALVRREREDLAASQSAVGQGDTQLVRATLARVQDQRRARRRAVLALAAGLILALSAGWWFTRASGEPVPELLLGGEIRCENPVGHGADPREFRWKATLRPRTHFELRLFTVEDGRRAREHDRIPGLSEPRWTPSPEELQALPSPLIWEVLLIDDTTGAQLASGHGWTRPE